jgi:hypothetical protein
LIKIKFVLLILSFVFGFQYTFATVYYISNYGDDSNDGNSPVYPIQSIAKLNTIIFKLQPGDAVLFERGSVFYGQININNSGDDFKPLVFGAYGNGRNPIISGSIPLNDWSKYKGKIYNSIVPGIVSNLFLKNEKMILARFPNEGFLKIERSLSDPKKGFIDNSTKKINGYWNGSIARLRSENWAYEYSEIKSYVDGKFLLTKETNYPLLKNWGYYLDNNFRELDISKEWYFEKTGNNTGNLFFIPPGNTNPNNLNLYGTIYDYGFFSIKELINIVIEDIEFQNQNLSGIYFAKSKSKIRIDNCTFSGQNQMGFCLSSLSDYNVINNCRFENINGKALYLFNSKNSKITGNIFVNIGMIPGYGTTGDPFPMTAVLIFGNNNVISGNYINNIGHDGINCIGEGNLIEENIIKNCLLLLNDGGGIKCFGNISKNSKWQNNFISGVKGNNESTDLDHYIALGIYLDQNSGFNTIINNTVTNCGFSGIGLNDGFNNVIEKNVIYNNPIGINFYQNNSIAINNNIRKNIVIGTGEDQYSLEIQFGKTAALPGRFEENYYYNVSDFNKFRIIRDNLAVDYNFSDWNDNINSDRNSKLIRNNGFNYSKLLLNMTDDSLTIILNSDFKYKDIQSVEVIGSVKLDPWTSKVLLTNSDANRIAEIVNGGNALEFGNIAEGNTSKPKWIYLNGNNLSGDLILSAPDGFELSLNDDSGYSKNISVIPDKGKIEKIIYVKFVPDKIKKYYDFIITKSGTLTNKIKVSGNSR